MLRYLSSSAYRDISDELHNHSLTGKHFRTINYTERRKFVKKAFHFSTIQNIIMAFEIQEKNKKVPEQMLKSLWLVHLIVQESEDWQNGHVNDLLIEQVNFVWENVG